MSKHEYHKPKPISVRRIIACLFVLIPLMGATPSATVQIALLKYNGGGDWYCNPTSLTNLISFCNSSLQTNIDKEYATVDVGSAEIFNYPFIHMRRTCS